MKIRRFLFVISAMLLMVQGASAWSGSGTSSGDPYLIASPADWETFATSNDDYSGKFFKLTADITVTTMRTKTFSGTFDGGGNTLTFNYTATEEEVAPFRYITGATIKNLRVAGTINTGYKFAAGIVAISNGGSIENCQSSVTKYKWRWHSRRIGGRQLHRYARHQQLSFRRQVVGNNYHKLWWYCGLAQARYSQYY